jgi:3-oxoacyl-[acyl-carrier protein] reductase
MRSNTAIVTGASRGLGREIAIKLAKSGYDLGLSCRSNTKSLENTAFLCRQAGAQVIQRTCDVRSPLEIEDFFNEFVATYNNIGLLINNAGMSSSKPVTALTPEEFSEVIETNLTGAGNCIKSAARPMMKQRSGSIINIGSLSALSGIGGGSAYSASKCGLIGLTRSAAAELGKFNVQVNIVLPGYLPTRMTDKLTPARKSELVDQNLLGRPSTFEEVCNFIINLANMKNVSGQLFNLDSRLHPWS